MDSSDAWILLMPNPKPMSASEVRIHEFSVRSAAARLRSLASSVAILPLDVGALMLDPLPMSARLGAGCLS